MHIHVLNTRSNSERVRIGGYSPSRSRRAILWLSRRLERENPQFVEGHRRCMNWKCENGDYWDAVVHGLGEEITHLAWEDPKGDSFLNVYRIRIAGRFHRVFLTRC